MPDKLRMAHAPALDGFRAIAILLVMASHAGLGKVVPGGFGVTIFFFLSGYLITSLLRVEAANTGKIDIRGFYVRRTVRIFPPLYITGAIVVVLSVVGMFDGVAQMRGVTLDTLFLTNYAHLFGETLHSLPMPLWSLDVEEHFYILFSAAFAFALVRMTPAKAATWCAAACGVFLAIRCANVVLLSDFSNNYYWSHTRMDSILFGCVLAMWNNPAIDEGAWEPKAWHIGIALAVLLLCLGVRSPVFRETVRYTLQGLALFVLFSAALRSRGFAARILGSAPLRWVALISYTLYLVHLPLIQMLYKLNVAAAAPLGLVIAVAYSAAMYFMVEKPMGKWRRQRHNSQPGP